MSSHCLNHPGIAATKRCVSCLKPLCNNCHQLYAEGIFCSDQCHELALKAAENAAVLAADEKALRERRQKMLAYKMIAWVAMIAFLFVGWDYFPATLTENVENLWDQIVAAFKGTVK
ncbi:MAG: hypothetical protein KC800_04715 [Candidatus Eremiobacteraeota bacterium]|nr:hypothetical protein [Candidatus Eremiobacteraeota bacterium]